ncbi:ABC transporter permease [Microbulbifer halophilus]|uniref:ABC transporter permease n=1 Tax=Microbulbifer halophilus TaxID=453963 RepID=A0ABW5EEV2_9GAMM|nr:ABC transporter permease [Microbulbifer halophilus]MCW8126205.1 ABC transporter permease [Microbulbifer halophilus]
MLADRMGLPLPGGWGNIGFLVLACLLALGFVFPLLLDLSPYRMGSELLQAPSWNPLSAPLLGTDDLGRDMFARLVYGARCSLGIGFVVVTVSLVVGVGLGLLAGVYGGWLDTLIMRLVDLLMCLPSILLAIVIVAVLGSGLGNAIVAVTIIGIPRFVRVVRAVAIQEMQKTYVTAAFASGSSRLRVLCTEVLPNCVPPVIVQAALGFSDAILEIAALGFLGLGAKPPVAEWGAMLADARPFIESHPLLVVMPGVCILLTVLSFNLVGDALRDRLDPKMERQ